jgi:hypothetical protein
MTQVAFPMFKHCPGTVNILANIVSCSFVMFHDSTYKGMPVSTDILFLDLYALTFPLPSHQEASWLMLMICHETHSLLIVMLLGKKLMMQQWTLLPVIVHDNSGQPIVWSTDTLTPSS